MTWRPESAIAFGARGMSIAAVNRERGCWGGL